MRVCWIAFLLGILSGLSSGQRIFRHQSPIEVQEALKALGPAHIEYDKDSISKVLICTLTYHDTVFSESSLLTLSFNKEQQWSCTQHYFNNHTASPELFARIKDSLRQYVRKPNYTSLRAKDYYVSMGSDPTHPPLVFWLFINSEGYLQLNLWSSGPIPCHSPVFEGIPLNQQK